ncbi:TPA: DEAD/DEAH box helicase [Neisseria meningitidis]|uniref:DEAD-box ATP-dependent RNA helicase RhpA n=3 Tax=Neisseria meningitidis TaxID=487 RepID=E0N847_NEIM3|nr:DEAD/DEAH box helicase [Neisseria meningitidis]EFM04846.1 DEAD/DEAH box helicase [Neisseria meningitidis ATCC 13091]MBG8974035.1 DEAD/DEAH box helicase [Neisseria meningitidis]MBG9008919.1 DEAD/DEAH box helicase [Neisseria meningitidis]MBG9010880.1 DEAD/DEAH box helicase [Neisseria meningitidis]MBG9039210.1 DEAD/DEAH box helicase [Neisseria meningitidis]
MSNPFSSLGLGTELVSALTAQGYENPTPIQAAAIPKALAGHDLLAAAQTGTGKTAAFMLPSLERLKRYATASTSPAMHPVRMLVLTPTRELADQIDQNVQSYIKNLPLRHTVLFGGMNMDKQTADLRAGCEIVVATVGRLLDHVKQKNISLNKVEIVVLDEADRMLDMGFIDDIRKIMQMLPRQRQTLLFSATFSAPIRKLAQDFMNAPETVEVAAQNTTNANVEQHIIAVDTFQKRNLLERLIVDLHMNQVIVFCKTKQSVDRVTRELVRRNLSAQAIHGDRSQQSRLETLNAFKDGSLRVLVATDIAARGLDIAELPFVINYEMPAQPEDYVHRIGRTGRAGADGVAISLMDESEQKMFESIKELTGNKLLIERIEGFEPQWWEQGGAKPEKPEMREPRQRNRYESAKAQREKNTRPENAANDAGAACGKIAGRSRRSRREHRTCALLQPRYGVK